MCAPTTSEECARQLELKAELERHVQFLEDQLTESHRQVSLLELNITELWHQVNDPDESLPFYLGRDEADYRAFVEARVSL